MMTTETTSSLRDPIVARAPRLSFEHLPKHWFFNHRAATHLGNGINLLFPAGERFFVRSVVHYFKDLPPELAESVRGFFGQEGRHAQTHERMFAALRRQGFQIDHLLETYERVAFKRIEAVTSPALRLSATAALEHFTAVLAEDMLSSDALSHADREMRRLFEWHAVEELEHKAVAFEVLQAVAPGYGLRMAGLLLATVGLGTAWAWMTSEMLTQDGSSLLEARRQLRALRMELARIHQRPPKTAIFRRVFERGIRDYLKKDFHPNQRDHRALIRETLERLAKEGVLSAA